MKVDVKRKMLVRSGRVKSIDLHPTEPWVLAGLYTGKAVIWNYETQAVYKTFDVCDGPVRAARFISRKGWIVVGSDDFMVRVYNYGTHELIKEFEAHRDYVRDIAVHPVQPWILTCSDDASIRVWNWDRNWKLLHKYEGHSNFIMSIEISPKDPNLFASASVDRTVKVWSLSSVNVSSNTGNVGTTQSPNFTLDAHGKSTNCLGYYSGSDKPYLVTGGDDKVARVWDYVSKSTVATLEGHNGNVNVAKFHPRLPLIITAAEDNSVKLWNGSTYRMENSLNYGLDRPWCISFHPSSNVAALGFDGGVVVIQLGKEDAVASMDNSGKLIWAKNTDIMTANLRASSSSNENGARVSLQKKELGNCDIFPQSLQHSPNGRFVAALGDSEYIIYTALAWRNKAFGSGLDFAWAPDSNEYAVRESTLRVKLYRSFKERTTPEPLSKIGFSVEGMYGGALLALRGNSFLSLHDWESGHVVRRIDVVPKSIHWSDSGDLFVIATEDSFFLLKYVKSAFNAYLEEHGSTPSEEGVDEALDFIAEISSESIKSGTWIGDCFIFTNAQNKLSYIVSTGQVFTIAHLDSQMSILGYVSAHNRLYLADKDMNVVSYILPARVIEYQVAIIKGDLTTAHHLLPDIPLDQRAKLAHFLVSQGHPDLALNVTTDPDHKFELAIQLNKLDVAVELANESSSSSGVDDTGKWRLVSECAMASWNIPLAVQCMKRARDYPGLLLVYSSTGNVAGLRELAAETSGSGSNDNIAFTCYLTLGQYNDCLELLLRAKRIPEAAVFARTYLPSQAARIVHLWKAQLVSEGKPKTAEAIADPSEYENLFPGFQQAILSEIDDAAQHVGASTDAGANVNNTSADGASRGRDGLPSARAYVGHDTEGIPLVNSAVPDIANERLLSPASPNMSHTGAVGGLRGTGMDTTAATIASSSSPTNSVISVGTVSSTSAIMQGMSNVGARGTPGLPPFPPSSHLSRFRAGLHGGVDGTSGGDEGDNMSVASEALSYLSMEVNTTGTGSVRGDIDIDDNSSQAGFE
ncbi:Coatomer, beta' subunit [Ramicandelaber brevisporus]|nr:Coatomer, beta' subunit [Ramicandelaber brevisporus]